MWKKFWDILIVTFIMFVIVNIIIFFLMSFIDASFLILVMLGDLLVYVLIGSSSTLREYLNGVFKFETKQNPKKNGLKKEITEDKIVKLIAKNDKLFSKEQFYAYVESIFVVIMKHYSNNDYRKLRMYEADELYSRDMMIIKDHIEKRRKHIRNMIIIKGILLKNFKVEDGNEYLSVVINVRMKDYLLDIDGCLLDGDNASYVQKRYLLTFVRKSGVKSMSKSLTMNNCPNCGAVIKVNDVGICNYCKSSLVCGDIDWSLCYLDEIKE